MIAAYWRRMRGDVYRSSVPIQIYKFTFTKMPRCSFLCAIGTLCTCYGLLFLVFFFFSNFSWFVQTDYKHFASDNKSIAPHCPILCSACVADE